MKHDVDTASYEGQTYIVEQARWCNRFSSNQLINQSLYLSRDRRNGIRKSS